MPTIIPRCFGWSFATNLAAIGAANIPPSASPTIETSATPAATPTVSVVKKKPITIQCIKGKTVKKVTAVAPKCPAGFKKKG